MVCLLLHAGTTPLKKQLKESAVPSLFYWTEGLKEPSSSEPGTLRSGREYISHQAERTSCSFEAFEIPTDLVSQEEVIETDDSPTLLSSDEPSQPIHLLVNSASQTPSRPMFSIENFINDNAGIMFYTGLSSYQDFTFVLQTLGESIYHLNYLYSQVENMNIEDQFFLTLIKLRQYKTNFELSRLFSISEFSVCNIWITWVNLMSCQWREIDLWPDRDIVRFFCPTDFFHKFPTTRVIVDGTECPVKKPKPPIAQQSTFSTYKNRNTIKVLAGATPGGLISYLSPAYGGSTSDRQIVERSSLMNLCDKGDSIMADKGFNVQDLFAPHDVTINIPTFFKNRNQMSNKTVQRDRKISSKRVHIERLIGLAKTYKILTQALNTTETKLASEITFCCFMLCNFRRCIIPKHA
ncbi:uncharacterized protein LOC133181552 [Saccostrea echinata]|uniref:uncharacterized protein LOC133181552 n=1 Tax=Saccostrea echinata TaxID=191078 RepID=UPI002A828270|nr:uncharacterized protein LOC133181552 [Saccostrea echinata]